MQGFENLSERQAEIAKKILMDDDRFHSQYLIADYPFADIAQASDSGILTLNEHCSFNISSSGASYDVTFRYSEEYKVWFFTIEWANGRFDGILRFNTVFNAHGSNAFVFLNDSDDLSDEDIGRNIPYSNFIVMVK